MKIFDFEQNIYEKLNIKQKDFAKIGLLFAFSFSLGLFIALYFVPANTEFVVFYGSQHLPMAYIMAGIVGYLSTTIYSIRQKKTKKNKSLFLGAVVFMIAISIVARLGLFLINNYKDELGEVNFNVYTKYLSFFVFIWAWPFISLVAIVTGGLAIRLLNLIQVKRYFGIINIGGIIASIFGYFIIPILLKFLTHQYDLIGIGILGLISSFIIVLVIYKKFPEEDNSENQSSENADDLEDNNFWKIIRKQFFFYIFISASLSTIAIYLSDYGFLVTIKEQPQIFKNKEIVSLFLSIVFGGLKVGELILSIFSSRILSKWGIRLGLVIMPISVCLLITLAFLSGTFIGISSIAFLVFITLNKSLERILRRGLDDPSFNVLYQTLPENQKLFIQTRVGVVMQLSIAIAGIILYIISQILTTENGFNLTYYPVLLIPFLIIWVLVAFKLYTAYKEKIRQILAEKRMFEINLTDEEVFGSQVLEKHLLGEDINVAKFSVVVLAETNPRSLEAYANFLLKINDRIIRKVILKSIDPTYNEKISQTIETIGNNLDFKDRELHKMILTSLYHLDYSEITTLSNAEIKNLNLSVILKDKIKLTKYLFKNEIENDEIIISDLLNYNDKAVKLAAIKIASKRQTPLLLEKLVEFLNDSEFNNLLVNIFVEIGTKIIPHLKKFFDKNNDVEVLLKIIEIYAKIGDKEAEKHLIELINYPDREIQSAVITALHYSGYIADIETIPIIKKKIISIAENILWFFVAIKDIEKEKNTLKLIQSLDLERDNTYELLFQLLSFINPPETIELIKTNIIGENTIFALEIIDNFISNDIKRIIIPLFDKLSVNQRIKSLKQYFYIPEIGFDERLRDIILKDYNKVDIWTKTKAIELSAKVLKNSPLNASENLTKIQINDNEVWTEEKASQILKLTNKEQIPDEIFVSLYHNSELVYSTAAKIIYEYSPVLCINYLKNLSLEKQKLIDILNETNPIGVLIDRVKLLKRIFLFYTVPEKSLVKLAKIINSAKKKKGDLISFTNKHAKEDIIILIKGTLVYTDKKQGDLSFQKNDVIIKGLNVPQNIEKLEVDKSAYIVFINRFEYFNLLVTDKEIIEHLFDRMKF